VRSRSAPCPTPGGVGPDIYGDVAFVVAQMPVCCRRAKHETAHVMPGAEASAVETIAQRLGRVDSGG
jgi:hypothetical protein